MRKSSCGNVKALKSSHVRTAALDRDRTHVIVSSQLKNQHAQAWPQELYRWRSHLHRIVFLPCNRQIHDERAVFLAEEGGVRDGEAGGSVVLDGDDDAREDDSLFLRPLLRTTPLERDPDDRSASKLERLTDLIHLERKKAGDCGVSLVIEPDAPRPVGGREGGTEARRSSAAAEWPADQFAGRAAAAGRNP